MFKKALVFVAAVLVMGALAGCGGSASNAASSSTGATSPASTSAASTVSVDASKVTMPEDITTTLRIFLVDHTDEYDEYIAVRSGKDTGALKSFSDITHFYKSTGITIDDIEALDVETIYPSFNSLNFATKTIEEKKGLMSDDYFEVVCTFDDLKNKDNLLALDSAGILTLADKNVDYVTGDSLCDLVLQQGGQEIDSSEYVERGLPLI